MAILTNSGRVAMAISVKAQDLHLAWGSGDAAWDTTPVPESIDSTALLAEIGRRKATYVNYCEQDVAGAIIVPTGRFAESAVPTKHLYMRFAFDFTDAPEVSVLMLRQSQFNEAEVTNASALISQIVGGLA